MRHQTGGRTVVDSYPCSLNSRRCIGTGAGRAARDGRTSRDPGICRFLVAWLSVGPAGDFLSDTSCGLKGWDLLVQFLCRRHNVLWLLLWVSSRSEDLRTHHGTFLKSGNIATKKIKKPKMILSEDKYREYGRSNEPWWMFGVLMLPLASSDTSA